MEPSSVEIVKGWTRSTVVATILAAAAEVDLSDPEAVELDLWSMFWTSAGYFQSMSLAL